MDALPEVENTTDTGICIFFNEITTEVESVVNKKLVRRNS